MSAGQIWERPDGLRWVELQAPAIEPSRWRVMVPLVNLDEAPEAPPLVVTVDGDRARVHLITSVHVNDLGSEVGQLAVDDLHQIQIAARQLISP